ncbi:MAG: zf-HC2 domain-containing protein, partial [Chloroflexota bacterium]|nr:zf-HC2 domain-containing protein [Chloroflexota bacterium]
MTLRGGGHPDELISGSLSGDLTDAERAELDTHLARCERCRATLAAFKSERRILSGLPMAGPPGDLPARVRSGIEAGRFGAPWWRRPGSVVPLLASAATFAAVVLGVVFFGKLQLGPVGQASGSPQSSPSSVSSSHPTVSGAPSAGPTLPPAFLGLGELGYLSLNGGSLQPSHLTFVNDASGASIDAGIVSGPPIAASLSPDGQWLAYITQKGETGANEIWVLSLASAHRTLAGCSLEIPFGHQLSWSPHGDLLAFTVSAIDLGAAGACPQPTDPDGTTRAWLFSVADLRAAPLMEAGPNSYAASFVPFAVPDAPNRLWVSHAGEAPSSELMLIAWPATSTESLAKADGVFLPILSPDGNRALFWRGTM